MCGRYGQTQEGITNFARDRKYKFNPKESLLPNNWNLSPGNSTHFFLNTEKGIHLNSGYFGYKPFFNPKIMWINARAEGKLGKEQANPDNNPDYKGEYNIGNSGAFSNATKNHRCIIPVDYFIEGPEKEKLSKPFKIQRKDSRPFGLAAVFSYVEEMYTLAIITTAAAPLLEKIGHHRSPFVLENQQEDIWLDSEISYKELKKVFSPFDSSHYMAIPLSNKLKSPNRIDKPNNSQSLIEPIGENVYDD